MTTAAATVKKGRKSKKELMELLNMEPIVEPATDKKRMRKKAGAAAITSAATLGPVAQTIRPNIILHLKCSMKDLQNMNVISGISFNPMTTRPITPPQPQQSTTTATTITTSNICQLSKKIKDLEQQLHFDLNNNVTKKSACFWDTCDFDNQAIYIPKYYLNGSYQVYGCFCSPECAVAYLMNENIDSSAKFERYYMLNHIYGKLYENKKNIKPAPVPFYMLDKFYGNLTIQEYRTLLNNDRLYLIIDKPLTRTLPELHEDNEDFILNNKIIPSVKPKK